MCKGDKNSEKERRPKVVQAGYEKTDSRCIERSLQESNIFLLHNKVVWTESTFATYITEIKIK